MNELSVDRRVRKTKKLLRQSLAELLQQKPVNSITVREISEMADINRGTFYLHYKDIYDMVDKIQNEMFEEFYKIVEIHHQDRMRKQPLPMLKSVFEYLAEHSEMAIVLMSKNGDAAFVERLKNVIKDKCFTDWTFVYKPEDNDKMAYFYGYVVSGCIGIFQMWLQNGMKESPQSMAELTEKMVLKGLAIMV